MVVTSRYLSFALKPDFPLAARAFHYASYVWGDLASCNDVYEHPDIFCHSMTDAGFSQQTIRLYLSAFYHCLDISIVCESLGRDVNAIASIKKKFEDIMSSLTPKMTMNSVDSDDNDNEIVPVVTIPVVSEDEYEENDVDTVDTFDDSTDSDGSDGSDGSDSENDEVGEIIEITVDDDDDDDDESLALSDIVLVNEEGHSNNKDETTTTMAAAAATTAVTADNDKCIETRTDNELLAEFIGEIRLLRQEIVLLRNEIQEQNQKQKQNDQNDQN